jgi:hypothetical protein
MANLKSDLITKLTADPRDANDAHLSHSRVRRKAALCTIAAADNDADVWGVCRLAAHDHILDVKVLNSAITGGTAYDLGVFAKSDWASASTLTGIGEGADGLFDGQSMASARDVPTSLLGAGTNAPNAADYGKAIWAMMGVAAASEPARGTEYDIGLTGVTVGTAAGTVLIEVWYVAGD